MDEEIAMPMYTHDDCGFADDASSGACEGPVTAAVSWNLEATCEADLVIQPCLPLCDRHRALADGVDWDGAADGEVFEGWHEGEIDLANVRI